MDDGDWTYISSVTPKVQKSIKGQITISSYPSPLFGIQFLAISFAFDFAFKMHISKKKVSSTQ